MSQQQDPHIQLDTWKSSLQRRMRDEHGIELKVPRILMTMYIVCIAGRSLLSKISDEQKELMGKLRLEKIFVCVIIGLLAGKTKLRCIVRWCRSHLDELRKHMPFPNGVPFLPAMSRGLAAMDVEMASLAIIN